MIKWHKDAVIIKHLLDTAKEANAMEKGSTKSISIFAFESEDDIFWPDKNENKDKKFDLSDKNRSCTISELILDIIISKTKSYPSSSLK